MSLLATTGASAVAAQDVIDIFPYHVSIQKKEFLDTLRSQGVKVEVRDLRLLLDGIELAVPSGSTFSEVIGRSKLGVATRTAWFEIETKHGTYTVQTLKFTTEPAMRSYAARTVDLSTVYDETDFRLHDDTLIELFVGLDTTP